MFEQLGPELSDNHVFLSMLTKGANIFIRVCFVYLEDKCMKDPYIFNLLASRIWFYIDKHSCTLFL